MDETYRFIKNSELNYLMYTLTTISIKDGFVAQRFEMQSAPN